MKNFIILLLSLAPFICQAQEFCMYMSPDSKYTGDRAPDLQIASLENQSGYYLTITPIRRGIASNIPPKTTIEFHLSNNTKIKIKVDDLARTTLVDKNGDDQMTYMYMASAVNRSQLNSKIVYAIYVEPISFNTGTYVGDIIGYRPVGNCL